MSFTAGKIDLRHDQDTAADGVKGLAVDAGPIASKGKPATARPDTQVCSRQPAKHVLRAGIPRTAFGDAVRTADTGLQAK